MPVIHAEGRLELLLEEEEARSSLGCTDFSRSKTNGSKAAKLRGCGWSIADWQCNLFETGAVGAAASQ